MKYNFVSAAIFYNGIFIAFLINFVRIDIYFSFSCYAASWLEFVMRICTFGYMLITLWPVNNRGGHHITSEWSYPFKCHNC